jgi:transcriptional regulator with PAS, ATPase and Fis domain
MRKIKHKMLLKGALKKAGSINRLAQILNVSRQVIQYWKKRGIPEWRVDSVRTKVWGNNDV